MLRIVLGDYESNYGNLIEKNGTTTMEIKRILLLQKQTQRKQPHDITVRHNNTAT